MNRFNNPLKLQQGGTTEDARTQVISVISEVAGITPEEVDSKLAQLSQNEEAVQLLSQGLQLLKEGNQEGVTIIKQLFSPQSAKNGGKIYDFICKHAKGGKVDCGCGVEKNQFGGFLKGLFTREPKFDGTTQIEVTGFSPDGSGGRPFYSNRQTETLNDGSQRRINSVWRRIGQLPDRDTVVTDINGDIISKESPDWISRNKGFDEAKLKELPLYRPNEFEEGGLVVKGLDGMSMNDAMEQAMSSKGYDRSQARFAYANAKNALRNQGLRGSELRQQARQMLAGNSEVEIPVARPSLASKPVATIDESSLVKPMLESSLGSLAGGSAELQLRNNSKMIQDYSDRDFNSAFGAARNAYLNNNGANVFTWKGRTYNTDLASGTTTSSTPVRSREEVAQTNQNTAMVQPGGGNTSWMWSAFDRVFGKKENGGIIEAQRGAAVPGKYVDDGLVIGPHSLSGPGRSLIDTLGVFDNGSSFAFNEKGREFHNGKQVLVDQNWMNNHPGRAKYFRTTEKIPIIGKRLVVRPNSYFDPIAQNVTETLNQENKRNK